MQVDDYQVFKRLLDDVFTFYGKDVSQFAADVWWSAMRPYSLDAVKGALNRHVCMPDNGQWLPKPADVVRLLDGGSEDQAQVAWVKVDKAVRQVGSYQSVVFDDAVIHAVLVDMGGWVALGNCSGDEWPFKAREFEKRYRGYVLRGDVEYRRVLIGVSDAQNELAGHAVRGPVMIGDVVRCKQVYLAGSDNVVQAIHRLDVSEFAKPTLRIVGSNG